MTLRIAEIFGPTIQGEGALIGQPTAFIRAGGCDYRCSWCDSLHAVESQHRHDWLAMEPDAIMAAVVRLSGGQPITVSISGGNPAIQDFAPVIELGKASGYRFACETQGSIARHWFSELAMLVLSPKPPSSGQGTNWSAFEECLTAAKGADIVMKIVIFDDRDLLWAREAAARYPALALYLQPGNPNTDPLQPVSTQSLSDRLLWLVEETVGKGWLVPHILPQLHVLIWGNKRGV